MVKHLLIIGRALFLLGLGVALWAATTVHVTARDVATPQANLLTPTPTVDRLAPPPTVENPTQADEGAYLYWLHCMPCHGDQGQGLTDEFRAQYPPEDRNCWTGGCHGDRPYEDGFTLPTQVPPVMGEQSLQHFETMGQVYTFIRAAMPYQAPGSLTDEEYLAITAFLARAHGMWDGTPFTPDIAEQGQPQTPDEMAAAEATPQLETSVTRALPVNERQETPHTGVQSSRSWNSLWLLLLGVLFGLGGIWVWLRRRRSPQETAN